MFMRVSNPNRFSLMPNARTHARVHPNAKLSGTENHPACSQTRIPACLHLLQAHTHRAMATQELAAIAQKVAS